MLAQLSRELDVWLNGGLRRRNGASGSSALSLCHGILYQGSAISMTTEKYLKPPAARIPGVVLKTASLGTGGNVETTSWRELMGGIGVKPRVSQNDSPFIRYK